MGGRGGGSGRGGGASTTTTSSDRGKVDHLANDYVGYNKSIEMLMKETGMSRAEAEKSYDALNHYFGSGYHGIRAGQPPSSVAEGKLIDKTLSKSRAYKGEIYRGIYLEGADYTNWKKQLVKGGTMDMGGISSWSSKKSVAQSFAKDNYGYSGQSIIFNVKSTKYGKPVQHLSQYGSGEAEVLASSLAKYKIKNFKTIGNTTYVNLAEVG